MYNTTHKAKSESLLGFPCGGVDGGGWSGKKNKHSPIFKKRQIAAGVLLHSHSRRSRAKITQTASFRIGLSNRVKMSRCIDGEVCVSCAESSRIPRLETRKDEKRRFSPLLFKTERKRASILTQRVEIYMHPGPVVEKVLTLEPKSAR